MELVVSNKNSKKVFKHTELGMLPIDWDVQPIGSHVDLLTGFPFPSNAYSENGTRLLRGSNIKRGVTDWSPEITQYWDRLTPELKEYILNEGDIVIAMDGSLVGRSFARLTKNDLPALLLQRVSRVRSTSISESYLKELICSDHFTSHCDSVKTVTAIPHISPADIKSFKIPLPPTKVEQTAIATALSDTDTLIQSLEKLIEKKHLIMRGVIQELLRPKKGWEVKRLGDVGKFTKGQGIRKDDSQSGEIPCVRYGELYTRHHNYIKKYFSFISQGVANSSVRLKQGDILFAGSGETKEEIGKCATFIGSECVYAGGDIIIFSPTEANSIFLGFLLNSKIVINQKANRGQGDSVVHITASQLQEILIPFPKLDVQTEVATILLEMDKEQDALVAKREKYKMIKLGMMQNLLTGKIRLC